MECPACGHEVMPDRLFCLWCHGFLTDETVGQKAGVFHRWVAWVLDGVFDAVAFYLPIWLFGNVIGIWLMLGAAVLIFSMMAFGYTPAKYVLGLRVVNQQTGEPAGFVRMFLRDTLGKFISAAFLWLGYLWALFDKDNQAWHDKLAGTVVVHTLGRSASANGPTADFDEEDAVPVRRRRRRLVRPPRG